MARHAGVWCCLQYSAFGPLYACGLALGAEERLMDLVPTEGVEPTRPVRDNGF